MAHAHKHSLVQLLAVMFFGSLYWVLLLIAMADDWKKESAPEHLEVIQANTIEIALNSAAVSTVEGKKTEIDLFL